MNISKTRELIVALAGIWLLSAFLGLAILQPAEASDHGDKEREHDRSEHRDDKPDEAQPGLPALAEKLQALESRTARLEAAVELPDFSNFGLPFATDETFRNVLVFRAYRPYWDSERDRQAIRFAGYRLRVRFHATIYTVSINGVSTVRPLVAMYVWVGTDPSGSTVSSISNWIDTPDTVAYQRYFMEQSDINPATFARTVLDDTESIEQICARSAGGAVNICIDRVLNSADGSLKRIESYLPKIQALLPEYSVSGMTFQDVRVEWRSNEQLRVRARGIGAILMASTRGTWYDELIYYRVDGREGGSLAGTPFEPGTGSLDGLFF